MILFVYDNLSYDFDPKMGKAFTATLLPVIVFVLLFALFGSCSLLCPTGCKCALIHVCLYSARKSFCGRMDIFEVEKNSSAIRQTIQQTDCYFEMISCNKVHVPWLSSRQEESHLTTAQIVSLRQAFFYDGTIRQKDIDFIGKFEHLYS